MDYTYDNVTFTYEVNSNNSVHLDRIAVPERYQNQGRVKPALQRFFKVLQEKNVPSVSLFAVPDDKSEAERWINFLRSAGFETDYEFVNDALGEDVREYDKAHNVLRDELIIFLDNQ